LAGRKLEAQGCIRGGVGRQEGSRRDSGGLGGCIRGGIGTRIRISRRDLGGLGGCIGKGVGTRIGVF
jgi:hypothetical protein